MTSLSDPVIKTHSVGKKCASCQNEINFHGQIIDRSLEKQPS